MMTTMTTTSRRLAHRLARGARRVLASVPLIALAALLPFAAARAAADNADVVCPPAALPLTMDRLQNGMRDAKDHGFLWRISKDGRSSYLYGTIHAARPEWMFPGPTVQDAVRSSDVMALELDVLDPDIQRRLVEHIGPQRDEPLPDALVRRIDRQLAVECVEASAFARFAPEFQIASLTVMAARRDGFDPAYAIDLVLAILARQLAKPIVSLETPESQMQALQMPTQAETIEFVTSGLDDLESGRARPLLKHIAKAWTDSDYAELARYEQWCDCTRTAAERAATKRLLDDRNPALAAGIDALHASGKQIFAAVGALHMIGPNGLPALMRQRGYKVEQGDFGR